MLWRDRTYRKHACLFPRSNDMIHQQLQNVFSLFSALKTFGELYRQASPLTHLDGWSLDGRDPDVIRQLMPLMDWFYHHYYRVSTDGWEHIPNDENVMLVGSHNGGLASPDMYMIVYDWCRRFGPERPLYGLMNHNIWKVCPALAHLVTQIGAIHTHPRVAMAALKRQASIGVYPGGLQDVFRPYARRHQIDLQNRKGFIKLAIRESVLVVPMISYGAHSTLIVLTDIYPLVKLLHEKGMPWPLGIDPEVFPIYLGLPWGLAIGPLPNLPLPVKIHTRICPPIRFEHYGANASRDVDYVNACYEQVRTQMQLDLDKLVAEKQQ